MFYIFHSDIYNSMKEKQMARDSHEIKTVLLKRESIMKKAEIIREANRALVDAGHLPKFNSPSRLLQDIVAASPPFQRASANSRRLGQHQGVSSSTYAVYEDNTVWSGVTSCQTITKTTRLSLPTTGGGDMTTAEELTIIRKKAKRLVRYLSVPVCFPIWSYIVMYQAKRSADAVKKRQQSSQVRQQPYNIVVSH